MNRYQFYFEDNLTPKMDLASLKNESARICLELSVVQIQGWAITLLLAVLNKYSAKHQSIVEITLPAPQETMTFLFDEIEECCLDFPQLLIECRKLNWEDEAIAEALEEAQLRVLFGGVTSKVA